MLQIPENVRQLLVQLLPASIVNEITGYVFYDDHPRDEKKIDVILSTKMGEVREYYKRDLLTSINIGRTVEPLELRILRNNICDLFYLVAFKDEIIILSRTDKLEIHYMLPYVTKYVLSDDTCSGKIALKVETEDSELPLVPDENFQNFNPIGFDPSNDDTSVDLNSPVIKQLMRKVVESRHTADCLKKSYKDFIKTRHSLSFAMYKKLHPNLDDSIFRDNPGLMPDALKICINKAWIKSCNKNIVIAYNICHKNELPLECVQIVLHGSMRPSLEYTTKIFHSMSVPPFWKESKSQSLEPSIESVLVVVIRFTEINDNILTKMEINGAIVFKKNEMECTLQIEDMIVSPMDIMGEKFDALCPDDIDNDVMLAILASTESINLVMRKITPETEDLALYEPFSIEIFPKYLHMDKVSYAENIVVFKKSPYHILNGLMVLLTKERRDHLEITVHFRCPQQVLAFIHFVQDAVPSAIVITTPNYIITTKDENFSINDDTITEEDVSSYNYNAYLSSVLKRTTMVLEYLDGCMVKMSESKNVSIRDKIGTQMDIFAQGEDKYKEFRERMWAEAERGVDSLSDIADCLSLSRDDDDDVNMESVN